MSNSKKYFYERGKLTQTPINTTYHHLLSMSDEDFDVWLLDMRKEILRHWDEHGTPPVLGKDESDIVENFKKLKSNNCNFLRHDATGDVESLGIIKNFNRDATVVNQFFPTMLKTKIADGITTNSAVSIYDYFANSEMKDTFITTMRRAIKKDSMYNWTRSLTNKKTDNPFWNGQSGVEFIKQVHDGKIFVNEWSDYDILISKMKDSTMSTYLDINNSDLNHVDLHMTAAQIQDCKDAGWLNDTQLSNIKKIEDSKVLKNGKTTKFFYLIRWYDKTTKMFPKLIQTIRLSCGQPVVNFPALTAKWLYETHTSHITQSEPLNIYDSSSGWGGRILGAMASRRSIHYIGTDPNADNYIDELGITRYEYLADFYNKRCIDDYSETFTKFFTPTSESNTYEIFRDGSEKIHLNPKFQKYENKLDLAFTSPPYFNREVYGDVGMNQSWDNYSEYNTWRDDFLRPTLTTIYKYLKNDRYILWNIASIRISKDIYFDLEGDSVNILKELGAEYRGKYKMLMARMVGVHPEKSSVKNSVKVDGTVYKYEPIFCFYKS